MLSLVAPGCRGKQKFEENWELQKRKVQSVFLSAVVAFCSPPLSRPFSTSSLRRPLSASPAAPRPAASASASASALPALDAARAAADDEERAPAAGRLVEFVTKSGASSSSSNSPLSSSSSSSSSSTSLALLLEPDGKRNWFAVDARGTRHSLKPAQIFYVFPESGSGENADESVLKEAAAAADAASARGSDDAALLRDAWEMSSPGDLLTAPALADLLYGGSSLPATAAIACVLRLMSSNPEARLLFKQVGRRPPVWSPRPENDVAALEGAARAAEAAAEALAGAAGALRGAAEAAAVELGGEEVSLSSTSNSSNSSPPPLSAAEWLSGPHRPFIEALDAFALEKATQAQASLATGVLRALGPLPAPLSSALLGSIVGGAPSLSTSNSPSAAANALRSPFPPTSDGAAALLSAVGFRPRLEIPALRRAGLTDDFEPELEAEARRLLALSSSSSSSSSFSSDSSDDPDARWRLDLTSAHRAFLAIDDASTTEVDDAVSVERGGEFAEGAGSGPVQTSDSSSSNSNVPTALWVHVADPTRWVTSPQHPLAQEAARRTRTLYLPTGPVPMFPRAAAEELFSLSSGCRNGNEKNEKTVPALSVRIPVLPDGSPDATRRPSLHVSTLLPVTRMTYDEADEILDGGEGEREGAEKKFPSAVPEDLAVVGAFAAARFASRGARGAATFDLPELQVYVDVKDRAEGDKVAGKRARSLRVRVSQLWAGSSTARRAVAESMIAANEAVALWGGEKGIPLPFRGQLGSNEFASSEGEGEGEEEKSEEQREMEELIAKDLENDVNENGNENGGDKRRGMTPAELVSAYSRIFSSQRSTLSTDSPAPHAGLGLDAYVQSTSPIRRYSDLVAHWQVKAKLRQLREEEEEESSSSSSPSSSSPSSSSPSNSSSLPWPTPASLASELSGAGDQARELSRAERAATAHWVGRYFADESLKAERLNQPKPTYKAILVSWIRRETGLARALLRDLGVETTLRLTCPARLGDELSLSHEGTDEVGGGPLFRDSGGGARAAAIVVVEEEGEGEDVVVVDDEGDDVEEEEGVAAVGVEVEEEEERPL